MPAGETLVQLVGISKDYRGLRPLRIARLELRAGQSMALLGVDPVAAEVLVNLVTGAMLPDTGTVTVLGRQTSDIRDPQAWLETLDHFGLLSERAVLLGQLTAEQNLAVPLSLELDDLPAPVRAQVRALAGEVGLSDDERQRALDDLSPSARLRVRLGRALALDPRVVLAEHPNASVAPEDVSAFAADFTRAVRGRGIAALVITADLMFARAVAEEVLTLQPASGELRRAQGWRRWLS
jgi:ABC-type transporter Mla maintaining outer membrane lipid asymmetry ATPase subunit MlaF